uniref:Basic tail protein n=1 Tax=Ixodes ricinus TaxID=34613 RepID=V5HE90_IXORI
MGLSNTTLLFVSLAFFGAAAAQTCRNGTRPASETKREGCDYYCWNTQTSSWDKYFFGDNEPCFYNSGLDKGNLVKNRGIDHSRTRIESKA